tara:strand:+ start:178 stop:1077 length:900 start_codon:yes stop_codon:yes gene_type:complete
MSAVGNINQYRTAEILDEENKYKREIMRNYERQMKLWSGDDADKVEARNVMTDEDKYKLSVFIQNFKNELDGNVEDFYNLSDETTNTGKLLSKWNAFVNFYKTNIDKSFKPYVDSLLSSSDVLRKIRIVSEMANSEDFTDKVEVIQLYTNLLKQNYEAVGHILFSEQGVKDNTSLYYIEPSTDNILKLYNAYKAIDDAYNLDKPRNEKRTIRTKKFIKDQILNANSSQNVAELEQLKKDLELPVIPVIQDYTKLQSVKYQPTKYEKVMKGDEPVIRGKKKVFKNQPAADLVEEGNLIQL